MSFYITEIHFCLTCETCGEDFHIKAEPASDNFEQPVMEARRELTSKGWDLSPTTCPDCAKDKHKNELKERDDAYIASRI